MYWACVFPNGMYLVDNGDATGEWTASGPRSDTRCTAPDGGGSCTGTGQYSVFEWNDWAVTDTHAGDATPYEWVRGSATWTGFDPSGSQDYLNPLALTWRPNLAGVCSAKSAWLPITDATGGGLVWLPMWDGDSNECLPGNLYWDDTGSAIWPLEYFASSGDPTYTAPPAAPSLEITGSFIPDGLVSITLVAADYDGEDVTCSVQADGSSPYSGTVASGEFVVWDGVATSFADNGVYAVECSADDGEFTGSDPAVESVRSLVTIGSGLENILSEDCGSWTNISCHVGLVLKWAFVPDQDVVSGFVTDVSEAFPFSLAADLIEGVTSLSDWDGSAAVRPGITLPAYVPGINDPGATLTILGPDLSTGPVGSRGSTCEYDAGDLGSSPTCYNWDGEIYELWGYRTFLRSLLIVLAWMGFALALYRRYERAVTGGDG